MWLPSRSPMAGPLASAPFETCRSCDRPILPGVRLLRVSYAIDVAGVATSRGEEPELLFADEYCSPECALMGTIDAMRHLVANPRVDELFHADVPVLVIGRDEAAREDTLATLDGEPA